MPKMHFESDEYTLDVDDSSGQLSLSLTFKKPQQALEPPSASSPAEAHRIVIPATDQHRRQGVFADEVVVHSKGEGFYDVESRTEPGAWHVVHIMEDGSESCTCVSHQFRRICRHLRAVRLLRGRSADTPLSTQDMAGDDLDALDALASYPVATAAQAAQDEGDA